MSKNEYETCHDYNLNTVKDIYYVDDFLYHEPSSIENIEDNVVETMNLDVVIRNGHKVLSVDAEKDLLKFFLSTKRGTISSGIVNSLTNHNYIFRASLLDALKDTVLREKDVELFRNILMTETVTNALEEPTEQLELTI